MFAPGLPSKKIKSSFPTLQDKRLPYVIQKHNADRAGLHYDFRISDGNVAYSWATRKGLPPTGVKHLFVRQPDHTPEYMSFQGEITDGYGKGKVSTFTSGNIHVLESSPSKIKFNIYEGQKVSQYTLISIGGDNWLCINITPTSDNRPYIPSKKVTYKEENIRNLKFSDDSVLAPKVDGSASIFVLNKNKPVEIFSYRRSKKGPELINRTYKYPELYNKKVPKELDKTILWGESFVRDSSGKALPYRKISGMLNMNTDKAMSIIKKKNYKFDNIIYNVDRFNNATFLKSPYSSKIDILKKVNKVIPELKLPEIAVSENDKKRLFESINKGLHPLTTEGVVEYNLNSDKPIKYKFKRDTEVYITGFKSGNGRLKNTLGKIIGTENPDGSGAVISVGSGFTDEERDQIWNNKSNYLGIPVKVAYQEKLPSGRLRMPIYKGIRFDY